MAKMSYNMHNSVKAWLSEILQVVFESAALCINVIRTFFLIVLSIFGPLAFGLSVFDGLRHSLDNWLAKYLNVFLWLPVANIFGSIIGKVQENMLKLDIDQVNQAGDTFFSSTDTAYLIFLLIGTVGYFTVPAVAGYIINPGGGNGLLNKVTSLTAISMSSVQSAGTVTGERMAQGAQNIINAPGHIAEGYRSAGYNEVQSEKLNGNPKK